jgi:formylglycine-generating enzyme required for sulfatase activity
MSVRVLTELYRLVWLPVFYLVFIQCAKANNIQVTNVSLTGRDVSAGVGNAANFIKVRFSLSWENSWRWSSSSGSTSYIGIKSGGSGYTSAPTVNISGGGGFGASATATITGGVVTGITITGPGSGYTSPPSVSFSGGGGSGAAADAYIHNWWDAAWVFVKYRVAGGAWQHAWLNDTFHTAPSGSSIFVGLQSPFTAYNASTNPGLGAFVYRNAAGSGNNNFNNVELRWNYGRNGVADDAELEIKVFAVEMVYVPQESFYLGDGETAFANTRACFRNGPSASAFQVTSESGLTLGGTASGNLANNMTTSTQLSPIDDFSSSTTRSLSADFPKGYRSFFCMKYEVSQGQYRDFLNTLNYTQQASRTGTAPNSSAGTGALSSTNLNRNGLDIRTPGTSSSVPAVYACNLDGDANYDENNDGIFVSCNFLTWPHIAAYLDWSGLRPMSEMEYEKACRGVIAASTGEFSWGSTTITDAANITNSGESNELCNTSSANCVRGNNPSVLGPMRVGTFATSGTNRTTSGASYWGIMELTGNNWERVASVGNSTGRAYTGVHGDGALNSSGDANQSNWPGLSSGSVTTETGAGLRGGSWLISGDHRVSGRAYINVVPTDFKDLGGRGVRSAPSLGLSISYGTVGP